MKAIALSAAVIGILTLAGICAASDIQGGNPGTIQVSATAITAAAPRAGIQDDWRLVRYKDHWWYWTAENRWMYFENGRWLGVEPAASRTGSIARTVAQTAADPGPPEAATATVLDRGNSCPLQTSQGYSCPAPASHAAMNFGTHGSAISFGF